MNEKYLKTNEETMLSTVSDVLTNFSRDMPKKSKDLALDTIINYYEKGMDINIEVGNTTLLECGASEGWVELVNFCINNKAYLERLSRNFNFKDKGSKRTYLTPLQIASWKGNLDITSLLVDKKANIEADSNKCFTPLWLACYNKKEDVARFLIGAGASKSLLEKTREFYVQETEKIKEFLEKIGVTFEKGRLSLSDKVVGKGMLSIFKK